jgi:CHAT domain-containing protein
MNKVVRLAWISTLLATAGPAMAQGVWSHMLNGRFADMAAAAEANIKSPADETTANLAPLCFALQKIRNYEKMFACVRKLEARIATGDKQHCPIFCFGNGADMTALPATLKAAAHLELGEYREAIEDGQRALSLNNPNGGDGLIPPKGYPIEVLPVLVSASVMIGDKAQAERYLKELEEHDIPLFSPGSFWWRNLRPVALARADLALGKYKEALENLQGESMVLTRALGTVFIGKDIAAVYEIPKFLMRAKAQVEVGNREDAKRTLDTLLDDPRIADQGDIHWLALYERARIAESEGRIGEAIDFYRRAIEIIEKQRASLATEAGKIGFVGDKQTVYERLVALLVAQDRAPEAFEYVERSKARALVDMLASKKDFATSVTDPEKARLILAQLDSADLAARSQHVTAENPGETGIRSLDIARAEIRAAVPDLSTLVTVTAVPPDELRSLVGDQETLIEYYYQGKELYAFVLDRQRLAAFKLNAEGLADEVQSFRRALQDPGSAAWQEGARELHSRLWQPIVSAIGGANIIIVPHGALHYLPFAALQDTEGKLVIDRHGLRFLPSASVLKYLKPPVQQKEGLLLALGNPDLGNAALDLKFAEDEARSVAKLFPQSRLLVRKDASESNLKKAGSVFSRIHFATHGKFQADEPLSSGLYLAKDADNDGILTVSELYSMKLDSDLVTLSACETGLGKVANGDDVVGLTRGFLYAGSRSIVASLWSVDDKATATLMETFYQGLPTLSKREALRASQLKTRETFPHPFFWAAFELTGRED